MRWLIIPYKIWILVSRHILRSNLSCDCIFLLDSYKKYFGIVLHQQWACKIWATMPFVFSRIWFGRAWIWRSMLSFLASILHSIRFGETLVVLLYYVDIMGWPKYLGENSLRNYNLLLSFYEIINNVLIHNFRCVHVWVNERFRKKHNS